MPPAVGSAVIDSLSLKALLPSAISVDALLHVRPPSSERLTSTALFEPGESVAPSKAIAIW